MNTLTFQLEYEWMPFEVENHHLIFSEYEDKYKRIGLTEGKCSHWDEAIYKWEGTITEGEHIGKTGILIGETNNIRTRLNQYKSGTINIGERNF